MIFKMPYKEKINITLIGCGGTGGFIAHSLARIIYDLKIPHSIHFIDGDRVEEKNIGRQNFYPFEIGKYKAQTLAERYSIALGLDIEYINSYLNDNEQLYLTLLYNSDIVISALDSAKSRKSVHNIFTKISSQKSHRQNRGLNIWIDTGNGNDDGQILIGNSFDVDTIKSQNLNNQNIDFIPYPSLMEPDLINGKKDRKKSKKNCSDLIIEREQSTTINNLMSATTSSIIYSLLTGKGIKSTKIFINETMPIITSTSIKDILKGMKK